MRDARVVIAMMAVGLIAGMAGAADVGVVDMDRLVKAHPKSDVNRDILRDQFKELESEKDAMVKTLKEKQEAFVEVRRQATDPAVSDAVRMERQEAANDQLRALQELEKEMGQRLMGRQREMNDQRLRMHKLVEDAVRDMVAAVAAEQKLSLVVDQSAVSAGGSNVVVFHKEKLDITDLILAEIDKLRKSE